MANKNMLLLLVSFFSLKTAVVLGGELDRGIGYWTRLQDYKINKFFYNPTDKKSQREDWYKVTPYVAEFYSTITNTPMLYVAALHMSQKPIGSAALACAGMASAISHAIPRHYLNTIDKIAAVGAVVGVAYDCNLFDPLILMNAMSNSSTGVPAITTGVMYGIDAGIARSEKLKPYRKQWQTVTHCLWHLCAAWMSCVFLSQVIIK